MFITGYGNITFDLTTEDIKSYLEFVGKKGMGPLIIQIAYNAIVQCIIARVFLVHSLSLVVFKKINALKRSLNTIKSTKPFNQSGDRRQKPLFFFQ